MHLLASCDLTEAFLIEKITTITTTMTLMMMLSLKDFTISKTKTRDSSGAVLNLESKWYLLQKYYRVLIAGATESPLSKVVVMNYNKVIIVK